MSKEQLFGLLMATFGVWLAVHCPRAAIREFRSGLAKGLNPSTHMQRDFAREAEPIGFWLTIVGTFLAGVMGLFFFVFGVATIFVG